MKTLARTENIHPDVLDEPLFPPWFAEEPPKPEVPPLEVDGALQISLKLLTWRFLQCSWISLHSNSVFKPTTSSSQLPLQPLRSHLRCSTRILKTMKVNHRLYTVRVERHKLRMIFSLKEHSINIISKQINQLQSFLLDVAIPYVWTSRSRR